MVARRWTPEEDQFLIDTHSTLKVAEQAARLERPKGSTRQRRSELTRRGLIDPTKRKAARPWTRQEHDMLIGWLQDGLGLRTIANRMPGRTYYAIEGYIERAGLSVIQIRSNNIAQVRTAAETADLFGVPHWRVVRWIHYKWLYGRRDLKRARGVRKVKVQKPYYRVTDESLIAFIKDRRYWPAWSVEEMTDPFWREFAVEQRAAAGGEWVSTPELARRMRYSTSTVHGWYVRGLLTEIEATEIDHTRYFWSADLEGFVPADRRRKAA